MADATALRLQKPLRGQQVVLPAAGVPWFLTAFGRDTLISAYQMVCFGQRLTRGTLLKLGLHQGTKCDDFSDEEPGKILHEVRSGELTQLGVKPYNPYFGAADATQLWLILLSEYWRWTRDDGLLRELRDNAYAALGGLTSTATVTAMGMYDRRVNPRAADRNLRDPGLHAVEWHRARGTRADHSTPLIG